MTGQQGSPRRLRVATRVAATIVAVFFSLVFVPRIIAVLRGVASDLPAGREWEGHVMGAMFVTFMAGYAVSWWRSWWGGVLIILAGFLVSVPFVLQGNLAALIFGLPQVVIGILYVLVDRIERR